MVFLSSSSLCTQKHALTTHDMIFYTNNENLKIKTRRVRPDKERYKIR